jgi:Lon protease-like protein
MSTDDYRALLAGMAKTAVENHTQRCGEACEALARVLPYEPAVKQYYENAEAVTKQADTIINVLRDAQRRHARPRRWPW